MKTSQDPRHKARIHIMQDLFSWEFREQSKPETERGREIVADLPKIDSELGKAAPEWPINQINKIDLAILRLAIFEIIIKKDVPFKVVVDEAVELAKEFGGESSPGFVNGVLGNVITAHGLEEKKV